LTFRIFAGRAPSIELAEAANRRTSERLRECVRIIGTVRLGCGVRENMTNIAAHLIFGLVVQLVVEEPRIG
jgi:hypothetical protein